MKSYNLKFKSFHFFVVVFGFLFFILNSCQAAVLYLEPTQGDFYQGDTFLVEIHLDTQGESINTAQINLKFSSDILGVQDLSQGNSILTLWVKQPSVSDNIISFIGGVPNGYIGINGLLGKIIFKIKTNSQTESAKIEFLNNSKILLNDGNGTEAKLITKQANFNILAGKLEIPTNEWQKELEQDKIPPQPFEIEISQNPQMFEGKYFITFSTADKETGIDHYEVKEGNKNWKTEISPYVLENQKLTDDIRVKAFDKAGNEWIEIIKAPNDSIGKKIFQVFLILILLLAIIKLGQRIIKNIRTKKL